MTQPIMSPVPSGADPHKDEILGLDHSPLISGLGAMLEKTDFAWTPGLIGEDQAGKLAMLTGDLRRPISRTGNGKRIKSGFLYLGTEPALAWANACWGHLYPVIKQNIESFDRRWFGIRKILEGNRTTTSASDRETARKMPSSFTT